MKTEFLFKIETEQHWRVWHDSLDVLTNIVVNLSRGPLWYRFIPLLFTVFYPAFNSDLNVLVLATPPALL